jgi:hypothetical protein
MTRLEGRYRRLLGVYPMAHRRTYEGEMLTVLMAGARPGQRFPALAEAADLLRAGIVARLGDGLRARRSPAWRDAAAVAGLLIAVVLAAVAGRRLFLGLHQFISYGDQMRAYGVDGLLLLDVALRTTAWLAVVVTALLGARRVTAVLTLAAAVEIGGLLAWLPGQEFRVFATPWSPVFAVLAVLFLVLAARGRPAVSVPGRRGTLLVAAGVVLAAASASLGFLPYWLASAVRLGDDRYQFLGPSFLAAGTLVLVGLWAAPPQVRRRTLVLLSPAVAVPVAQQTLWNGLNMTAAPSVTAPMIVAGAALIVGLPLAALALAVALLHLRERRVSAGDDTTKAGGAPA